MGMNDTPSGERLHIGFFGRRNAGKSSLVNAVTGQELAVVSDKKGTTTDPVKKAMELLPLGPVVIIDTPGFDDEGTLGELRIKKTREILSQTDIAVLVADATKNLSECDKQLIEIFRQKNINYLVAYNKCDLLPKIPEPRTNEIYVSALQKTAIYELKEKIATLSVTDDIKLQLVGDLVRPNDFVVLVTPIDSAAPKGRMILPQQQMIRDVLEAGAIAVVTKESELEQTLNGLNKEPSLVITDSQAFKKVAALTPKSIKLTSFSILMARYKGILPLAISGVSAVESLCDGDTVLIAEGCTHHRQCDDIGSVKIPRWLKIYTGRQLNLKLCSGTEFPEDLTPYKLIIHCGACMLNRREMQSRVLAAKSQNVPIVNYGIFIAYVNGILRRSIEIFPDILKLLP